LEKEDRNSQDCCQDRLGYMIKLAGGLSWGLTASPSASGWLQRIAELLYLKRELCNGEQKIIFTIKDNVETNGDVFPRDAILGKGWTELSLPPVLVRNKNDDSLAIFELDKKDTEKVEPIWLMLFSFYIYGRAEGRFGLPLHAALLEKNNSGFAIIAPSGRGKSTCSRRVPAPWKSLCDDECLVVRDKAGLYYAHPFPTWSLFLGKEAEGFEKRWDVQRGVPLKGIFMLEQSLRDEVVPMSEAEAAVHIYKSACQTCPRIWSYYSPEEVRASKKLLFENACMMSKSIPAFILRASLTGMFWEHMEKAIMTV
jgi:SynChlorMet cassette protein ScmC